MTMLLNMEITEKKKLHILINGFNIWVFGEAELYEQTCKASVPDQLWPYMLFQHVPVTLTFIRHNVIFFCCHFNSNKTVRKQNADSGENNIFVLIFTKFS